jgi:hypothetical protein
VDGKTIKSKSSTDEFQLILNPGKRRKHESYSCSCVDRFLQYVKFDTQSSEESSHSEYRKAKSSVDTGQGTARARNARERHG